MKTFKQYIEEKRRKDPREESLRLGFRKSRTERRIQHAKNAAEYLDNYIRSKFAAGHSVPVDVYDLKRELHGAVPKLSDQAKRISATMLKYR